MYPNSIYVDLRLFHVAVPPRAVVILEASHFSEARLRNCAGVNNIRLDVTTVVNDGDSVIAGEGSVLGGFVIKPEPGQSLLRHVFEKQREGWQYLIMDSVLPEFATLVGMRAIPDELPELPDGVGPVPVEALLVPETFEALNPASKAMVAMIKFTNVKKPTDDDMQLDLQNGWQIEYKRIGAIGKAAFVLSPVPLADQEIDDKEGDEEGPDDLNELSAVFETGTLLDSDDADGEELDEGYNEDDDLGIGDEEGSVAPPPKANKDDQFDI